MTEADEVKELRPAPDGGRAENGAGSLPGHRAVPRYARAGFWRAVAGMAIALALGCAIVAFEMSSELFSRSAHYYHHLHSLSAQLKRMRGQIETEDQQIAEMRGETGVHESLSRILASPDLRTILLRPSDNRSKATARLAMSHKLGRAVLEVEGVPPAPTGRVYQLWWTFDHASPTAAAQFQTRLDWRAAVGMHLPSAAIAGALVTVASPNVSDKPGAAVLKSIHPAASNH